MANVDVVPKDSWPQQSLDVEQFDAAVSAADAKCISVRRNIEHTLSQNVRCQVTHFMPGFDVDQ